MNHTTLAIAAIFATAVVLTAAAASALPQQQAFAHSRHHDGNQIRISQDINQLNNCTLAECVNEAQNDVQIHR